MMGGGKESNGSAAAIMVFFHGRVCWFVAALPPWRGRKDEGHGLKMVAG